MSKWHPIALSKPPCFKSVLVLFEKGGHYRARVVVAHRTGSPEPAMEWGPSIARKFKITHWAEIPALPDGGYPGPYG